MNRAYVTLTVVVAATGAAVYFAHWKQTTDREVRLAGDARADPREERVESGGKGR